jgi:hypothetical protein
VFMSRVSGRSVNLALRMVYPPDLAPRSSYPTFGTRAGLGRLFVAGEEERQRDE